MNTAIVNIRTDAKLKKQAQKVADDLGFSLSTLVNAYLKQLVKTGEVHFRESYEPTPYLKRLIKQAQKEHEEGKSLSFPNPKDALRYIESLIDSR